MHDKPARGLVRPRQKATRVGYFTDAVFAIDLTVLAIELPRPEGSSFVPGHGISKAQAFCRLWQFMVGQRDQYYAYFLAFLIIWSLWRAHHMILDQVNRVSELVTGLHFPLLLLSAFLPYAAITMGRYPDNPASTLVFGVVVGALLLCRSGIQSAAGRGELLLSEADRHQYEASTRANWVGTGYWLLTLPFVWWAPWVQIPWTLTLLVDTAAAHITRRWPPPPHREKP